MRITLPTFTHHSLLFWVGILGIVFYVISPIAFPHIPNLRQPELLPVYTLMMGLGQLLKGNKEANEDDGDSSDNDDA